MAKPAHSNLGARLRTLSRRADPGRLLVDPLGLVRGAADREGAALVAALLAFGQVASIRRSAARAIEALESREDRLSGFRHRWVSAGDLAHLLGAIREQRALHGSLEGLFRAGDPGEIAPALDAFNAALRGPAPSRGVRFLLPLPRDGSACKRPLLFLRWVARRDDGIDLGLWRCLDPARLLVPLDTHLHRIARRLGFTRRRSADWRAAEEVTAALRRFDPADPVRFDFALAHLGISGACPGRPVEETCAPCALRPHCSEWAPAAAPRVTR
jgi:uncharacterized protein (TIGR02757 family)